MKTGSVVKRIGRNPVFTKAQEMDLVKRVKKFSKTGMPLTSKNICRHAYLFCKENNIKNCFNDKKSAAGKEWLNNFLARNKGLI